MSSRTEWKKEVIRQFSVLSSQFSVLSSQFSVLSGRCLLRDEDSQFSCETSSDVTASTEMLLRQSFWEGLHWRILSGFDRMAQGDGSSDGCLWRNPGLSPK